MLTESSIKVVEHYPHSSSVDLNTLCTIGALVLRISVINVRSEAIDRVVVVVVRERIIDSGGLGSIFGYG